MLSRVADLEVAWFEVGRGTPVILIHGLGDDHRAWRRVVSPLMLDRQLLLYDFRGHGGTTLGTPDGTLDQMAGDLVGLLRARGLDGAVLVGFSLGGTIAMQAALDAPDLVLGLVLVATSSRINGAAREWYLERARLVEDADPGMRAVLDRDTEEVYRHRRSEIPDGLRIRRSATMAPGGYANACRAMAALREAPLDDRLPEISVPTLVVAGDADQYCPPRAGEIMAARIRGSELRVIPDSGHPLPVERPVEVARAITDVALRVGSN